ncbi:MAG: hypothetical protein RMA76_07810 [Deltaproteobacteria bacterium]
MSGVGRIPRLWPYALVAFLYLATWPYHRGLNNPNEMVRVYMTRALAEDGTFIIDKVIRSWGIVDDKAIRDGKLYSSKAPLQSLLGVPGYVLAEPILGALGAKVDKRTITFVVRIFGSAIFGIGFCWILIAWCRRRAAELGAPGLGTAIGVALSLGTMLYPYGITFTGHVIAAFAAGGVYLAVIALSRAKTAKQRTWIGIVMGFAAGATPFAEYPAALVALPALAAALYIARGDRLMLFVRLAIGGAAPFAVGLWAHAAMWGSPFKTGYSFLENKGYVEVHGDGFFGVTYPKWDAFSGSLFSAGTGLFFFSPILIVGLLYVLARCFVPTQKNQDGPKPLPRALAIAAVVGFVFSMLFISGHEGWRGGWTVGPRYIIAVAPVLGLWALEALAVPRLRNLTIALGGLSIVTTGFAAALYPHLSVVYTNPLKTFLWPSYTKGEMTYGIGHSLGLLGHGANAVHVVPLVVAIVAVLFAGARRHVIARALVTVVVFGVGLATVAAVGEPDPVAARRENRRLWGFWEPSGSEPGPRTKKARPGLLWNGRVAWRQFTVERVKQDGTRSGCPSKPGHCQFGEHPWQKFGPERLDIDGERRPVLFMHPIAHEHIRATFPVHARAKEIEFSYGLTDGSVTSDNAEPVKIRLEQAGRTLAELEADNSYGLKTELVAVTSTEAVTIDITVVFDGARVFGFDVRQY